MHPWLARDDDHCVPGKGQHELREGGERGIFDDHHDHRVARLRGRLVRDVHRRTQGRKELPNVVRTRAQLAGIAKNERQHGSLGCTLSPVFHGRCVPRDMGELGQELSFNLGVDTRQLGRAHTCDSLRRNGSSIALGIGTPERVGGELEFQTLMRDELCLVCQSDHPLVKIRTLRWRDLAGHAVVAGRPGYGVRQLVDVAAATAGVSLSVVNEISFLSTGLWMSASGIAPSIMPSAYARYSHYRELVVKKLHTPLVSRDIFIVTKKGRSPPRACERFVEVLRSELTQTP